MPRPPRRPSRSSSRVARSRATRAAKTSSKDGRTSRTRGDLAAESFDRLDHVGRRSPGIVDGQGQRARPVLADVADRRANRRAPSPSRRAAVSSSRMSPPIASRRRSSGVASAMSRPPAIIATMSHDSASLTYWVVTSSVRPASRRRWSSSQIVERSSGIDAGGRLVEEQEGGVVDERAGEFEATLHPARQPAGAATADVPQVEQLEDLRASGAGARSTACRTATRRSPRSRGRSGPDRG